MKKLLYFFSGCAVIGIIIAFIIGLLPAFPFAGKGFLISLEHKQYQQAYMMLSKEYQSRYDLNNFVRLVQQSGIDQYEKVEWMKTVIDKDRKHGYVMGIVTTKQNAKIPIHIEFIQQEECSFPVLCAILPASLSQGWSIADLKLGKEVVTQE